MIIAEISNAVYAPKNRAFYCNGRMACLNLTYYMSSFTIKGKGV